MDESIRRSRGTHVNPSFQLTGPCVQWLRPYSSSESAQLDNQLRFVVPAI
jgi:hypothetical protein